MNSREAIFAALFAKASASTRLRTKSRAVKTWTDVAPPDQPALFQCEGTQTAAVVANQPTKWTFRAELYLYVHEGSCTQDQDRVTVMNNEVDRIVALLDREPAVGRQTLGGLVYDCRISGDIETDEGRLGLQSVAVIPIEIIANT